MRTRGGKHDTIGGVGMGKATIKEEWEGTKQIVISSFRHFALLLLYRNFYSVVRSFVLSFVIQ